MELCSFKTMAEVLAQQPVLCGAVVLVRVRVRPCDHEARLSVCSDSQRACYEYKNTQHDRVGSTRAPGHVPTKQDDLWAKQPVGYVFNVFTLELNTHVNTRIHFGPPHSEYV